MYFEIIIGFITGIGMSTSLITIIKDNKIRGIIQLILSFLAPYITHLFCLKKQQFVFGGTNWEFLVQTATVDKMLAPWLILIMYISFTILIIYNCIILLKLKVDE